MTNFIAKSARLASLFAILDVIQGENEKTLIFLESLRGNAKVSCCMIQRGATPFPHMPMIISGEVSGIKRQERVGSLSKRFQL